jgi:succinate-semialdehyde dehydrogenase/glutarate-semialdehyde dehydrogenase
MTFQSINPATGEPLSTYEEWSTEEAKNVVCKVHRSYLTWSRTGFDHRASLMRNTADILNKNSAEYARLMAEEMGKPLAYFANNAENFLARQPVSTAARRSFIAFNPIRIVLAVMPWNFPFWQAFRFAAPSLMAGNAALLKHASNVPGCALAIEKIFREAGFPENLFRTLMIGNKQVDAVIEHPLVRAVTLTGSGAAGRAVASKVARCSKGPCSNSAAATPI